MTARDDDNGASLQPEDPDMLDSVFAAKVTVASLAALVAIAAVSGVTGWFVGWLEG